MKRINIICILFIFSIKAFSQWQNLGSGFDDYGRVMTYDTVNNILYVGGNFIYSDSLKVNRIAKWDGLRWDSLGAGGIGGAPTYGMTMYNGKLYASTVFDYYFPNNYSWLSSWNGFTWEWDTSNSKVNSSVITFTEENGNLYIGGLFTKIGQMNVPQIAKYDGATFTTFPLGIDGGWRVAGIEFFQGYMYIGGNFYDTITGGNDLERWNGTSFETFGGNPLVSGSSSINTMAVYNGELYMGGTFRIANGDPQNYIMRWDGMQFRDVGGGTDYEVKKMRVFNNELIVCGRFLTVGTDSVDHIAAWNGSQWHPLCQIDMRPAQLYSGIEDFYIHNNDLYITGKFDSVGSILVNNVAKYSGLNLGVGENRFSELLISPNPSSNKLNIEITSFKIEKITIYDLTGKLIKTLSCNSTKQEIDISALPSGLYFLDAIGEQRTFRNRFVKN